jgi:beta-galactosidase
MTKKNLPQCFSLGVAYYPDYIPPSMNFKNKILSDLTRMVESGVKILRVGEFSWSTLQPSETQWKPDIFLYFLDVAMQFKLNVIFCTPTATPPKWLIDKYPEILPSTKRGHKIVFGSRRHYDFCNPNYIEYSTKITQLYAQTFGLHPAVVGWQTDNEFGCHGSVYLFSENIKLAFQGWLKEKYLGQIGALNEAWFTSFWSQGYQLFSEIELPFESLADQNPSLELDYRRFCNKALRDFQKNQIQILKKNSPHRFITHNLMTLFFDLCPWEISQDIDLVGFDHYQMELEPHPISSYWQHSLMRSLKQKKFFVLEQQPVQVNWQPVNRRFEPDYLFLWTMQSAVLGASASMYFSWQKMYGGAEQYHDGIIPHDTRILKSWQEHYLCEQQSVFSQLESIFSLSGGIPNPNQDVLCLFDSESLWSHEIISQSNIYSTKKQIDSIAFWCAQLGLGLYFEKSLQAAEFNLNEYSILVIPGQAFELSQDEQQILLNFVEQGGTVFSYPRSCYKKRNNQFSTEPLNFYKSCPLILSDFGALLQNEIEICETESLVKLTGEYWAEQIEIPNENKGQFSWKNLGTFKKRIINNSPKESLYLNYPAILEYSQNIGNKKKGKHIHFASCFKTDLNFLSFIQLQIQEIKVTPFLFSFEKLNLNNSVESSVESNEPILQIIPLGDLYCVINFSHLEVELKLNPKFWKKGLKKCYFLKASECFQKGENFKIETKLWELNNVEKYFVLIPSRGIVFLN